MATGSARHAVVESVARVGSIKAMTNSQIITFSAVISAGINVSAVSSTLILGIHACWHAHTHIYSWIIVQPFTWFIYHYDDGIVADHYRCIGDESSEPDNYPKGNWFCNTRCERVHHAFMAHFNFRFPLKLLPRIFS